MSAPHSTLRATMRMEGKVSIVTGAGQTPGETIGNGRATSLLLAREGSKVLLVDRDVDRARETRKMIAAEGFRWCTMSSRAISTRIPASSSR